MGFVEVHFDRNVVQILDWYGSQVEDFVVPDDDCYCNLEVDLKDLIGTPVEYLIGAGHDAARKLGQPELLVGYVAAAPDDAHIVVDDAAQMWNQNWAQVVA